MKLWRSLLLLVLYEFMNAYKTSLCVCVQEINFVLFFQQRQDFCGENFKCVSCNLWQSMRVQKTYFSHFNIASFIKKKNSWMTNGNGVQKSKSWEIIIKKVSSFSRNDKVCDSFIFIRRIVQQYQFSIAASASHFFVPLKKIGNHNNLIFMTKGKFAVNWGYFLPYSSYSLRRKKGLKINFNKIYHNQEGFFYRLKLFLFSKVLQTFS